MFFANESTSDVPAICSHEGDLAWCQARIASLESELKSCRDREESSQAAVQVLHDELRSAQSRIAQQQEKLKALVSARRAHRSAISVPTDLPPSPSLAAAEIARLDHPYRKVARQANLATFAAPALRQPITGTESSRWVNGLWKTFPAWAKGGISSEDAAFLNVVIEKMRPDHVYEIGVASGASSALILSSMAPYADPFKVWLYSYDIADKCYFDQTHAVGAATREMVPALLEHWKLNTGTTALDVAADRQPGSRPLYFIDANHLHPWPTLDLIALLPALRPGDAIALHDINLPEKSAGVFKQDGAQILMDEWLGARQVPDVALPNIGVIQIPDDPRVLLCSLIKILSRPWSQPLTSAPEKSFLSTCEHRLAEYLRRHAFTA